MLRQTADQFIVQKHLSGIDRIDAGQQVERRCLAGPVGTDDPDDLPVVHGKGKILDCLHAAKRLAQTLCFQFAHAALAPFLPS